MMTKKINKKRDRMMVFKEYLLRLIDRAIGWDFIYDLVEERDFHDGGRPSMDSVYVEALWYEDELKKRARRHTFP